MKLFVGNLPHSCTDNELSDLFSSVGSVVSAKIIMDRYTQKSKGFGFVEMSSKDEAEQAIEQLNGKDFKGRAIVVNEARPQEARPPGGGDRSRGPGGPGGRPMGGSGDRDRRGPPRRNSF